ncbi:hypothetical protein LJR014_002169 [Arthrobacter sp. LjRoot14]
MLAKLRLHGDSLSREYMYMSRRRPPLLLPLNERQAPRAGD